MASHWFAWISFAFSILLLMKFVARKSKIKNANRTFRKFHESFATILGSGVRLFGALDAECKLKLIETRNYNGIVEVVYEKR